jgi:hypothetical protein
MTGPALPSLAAQAERLIELGVPELAGITEARLKELASGFEHTDGLLVTGAPPSSLAPLLTHEGRPGFVVEDMTDVDEFTPIEEAAVPASGVYVVRGLDRGDEFANRTPEESLADIVAGDRFPLTVVEGLHWALQAPGVLERNHCFMTIGSRLRRHDGRYDARTPALWISNGTGRDGPSRRNAPKLGWCWWRNRHTWLGVASCAERLG